MGDAEEPEVLEPPHGQWTAGEFELLLEVLPTALYRAPAEDPFRRLFIGGAIESLIGSAAAKFRGSFADWSELIHEDDLSEVRDLLGIGTRHSRGGAEYRVRIDNGDEIWLRDRIVPIRGAGDRIEYHLGLVIDITREKREEQTFAEVVEQAPCGMVLIDRDGTIEMCNRELERMFGYAEGALEGQPVEVLVPAADREEEAEWRARVFRERRLARHGHAPREMSGLHRDGREVPVQLVMSAIDTPSGLRVLASIVDNSERKRAREQLERANLELQRVARIDQLTGLANRRRFEEQLDTEWLRARRSGSSLSLLLFDVDFFKAYNDGAGHVAGDDALKSVAEVAQQAVQRPGDLCSRFGGEEFVILLPDTELPAARSLAERVRARVEALRIPHPGLANGRVLTISIGVASVRPGTGMEARGLLEAADRQLYVAKNSGRNRVASEQLAGAPVQGRAAREALEQ